MPQFVFVAVFDVLGFREIVNQTPLPQLREMYLRLQREKVWAASIPVFGSSGTSEWVIATTIFSDTIVLWAQDTYESLDTLIATCSVLIGRSVLMGWPLRGGVAYGECILDRRRRVFIGKPMVNAYQTEQAQDWIGAAFHDSCLSHLRLGQVISTHDDVVHYSVPTKVGKPALEWAIRWGQRIADPEQAIAGLSQGAPSSVQVKYANTLAFLRTFP
jgi:hypothetical protein